MKTKSKPLFSVIIPTLNEEVLLPRLLKDLGRQNYKNFEVIIVDANSVDKTVVRAKTFSKIFGGFLLAISKKRNVAYQRNLGAQKAKGTFLVFLDADVSINNNFLQSLRKQLNSHDADIITFWTASKNDKLTGLILSAGNILFEITYLLKKPYVIEQAMMVKKTSFTRLRGFNYTLHNDEGTDLVARAKKLRMKFIYTKNLRYYPSMRRFKKHGFLKVVINTLYLELLSRIHKNLSWEKSEKLYPMQGGNSYNSKK